MDSRQALLEADFAPLLMAYVQLTGDESALDRYGRWISGPWNFMENAPPEARRTLADGIARALEEGNRPAAISNALLRRMMSVCVGQPVPEEYESPSATYGGAAAWAGAVGARNVATEASATTASSRGLNLRACKLTSE